MIRAVVAPYSQIVAPRNWTPEGVREDATHGTPSTASLTIYDLDSTTVQVGSWSCTPGSFPVENHGQTECLHVLEGVFFVMNADGTAQRCEAGDTVVLPKGWTGQWDVIEIVRKLWVVVVE
jgi:uncharacterized cupin superfamily protein